MPRRTKKTIRRYPATARELIKLANRLQTEAGLLLRLAEKVATAETDSVALQRFMATVNKEEEADRYALGGDLVNDRA